MKLTCFSSLSAVALLLCAGADPAHAQDSGLFIDRGRLDATPPPVTPPSAAAPAEEAPSGVQAAPGQTLSAVTLIGETDAAAIAAINARLSPLRGKPITQDLLREITGAVSAYYNAEDVALHRTLIPPQDFEGGRVRVVTLKALVKDIVVEGVNARDAALLRRQAKDLTGPAPLRRAALERALLTMNSNPGFIVIPKFEPVAADPSAVVLKLTARRRAFQFGASVNNGGQTLLGRTQYEVTGVANSALVAGDSAQLYYGFPAESGRYQFYALSYSSVGPGDFGARGGRWSLIGSHLKTDPGGLSVSGRARTAQAQVSYPLERSLARSTNLSVALDALWSENAFLGNVISDDRTRTLRASLSQTRANNRASTTGLATLSAGLDILDARVRPLFGGPEFVKLNLRLAHDRRLGDRVRVKLSGAAQIAPEHLPSSERLQFGGPQTGRGFDSGYASAPRGLTAGAQIGRVIDIPGISAQIAQGEVFSFIDAGHLLKDSVLGFPERDLVSVGAGLAVSVAKQAALVFQVAQPIEGGRTTGDERFFFTVRAAL